MLQGKLIDVRGLQQVDRALRQVDPDLRRQMYKEIGGMVKKRLTAARDRMPVGAQRNLTRDSQGRLRGAGGRFVTGGSNGLAASTILTKAGSKQAAAAGIGGKRQGMFGFQAISSAPHASILDLATSGNPALLATLNSRYGPAPRFLGREFLPSGQGGTQMWRESRAIVEKYVRELNRTIEAGATSRVAG